MTGDAIFAGRRSAVRRLRKAVLAFPGAGVGVHVAGETRVSTSHEIMFSPGRNTQDHGSTVWRATTYIRA